MSAEEREHAEALRSFDPEFDAAVRQWERRLGELNVMVEAVEPPAEVWDKIKKEVSPEAAAAADAASSETAAEAEGPRDLDSPGTTDVVAGDFLFLEPSTSQPRFRGAGRGFRGAGRNAGRRLAVPPPLAARRAASERSADVVRSAEAGPALARLHDRLGAIAALLAAYIAVSQVAPDLIPPQLRAVGAGLMARTEPPVRGPQDRLVAVLQQQPTAPAFLLTVDTRQAHAGRAPSFRRA